MNFRNFTLALFVSIWSLTGYSQRNPYNEILVFFSEGITQKTETIKGVPVKILNFNKSELKQSLNTVGIPDSLMEFALPDFKRKDTLKILPDGREIKQPDMSKLIRIKVPKGKDQKGLIKYLDSLPEVLYAEPNGRVKPHAIPTDTRFNEQWGLRNTVNPGADIHAEAAWDIYTGNSNNIIAIIDGGTEINHEDLNGKITGGDTSLGWDGHGAHVSGIAAAESNNSQGISGVDWNARIHPQRIDNVDDAGIYQAILEAVNYSSNVKVLNNSWGLVYENEDPGRYSTTVRQAFAYAYKANRTSVASMGNHQRTHPDVVGYPAGFGNIIAVGATDNVDVIANFSVHGNHIDVCAPGVGILSTVNGDYEHVGWNGTSMAAPHVSGVASLLKGYNPNLANDDVENIIQLSADEVAGMIGQDYTTAYGNGRLNAESALKYLREPYTLKQWSAISGSAVSSTGTFQMVIMGASGLASSTYIVKRYEVQKAVTFPENFLHIEAVWTRGVYTSGWNLANPNFGEGFCEIVPGTLTDTGATLRTYVYQVWSISGSYLGYYPSSPVNVSFAYSVLGIPPPTLSGPAVVCSSGTSFSIINLPEGATITWGQSPNITRISTQGANPCTFAAAGFGEGWVEATITTADFGDITLPQKEVQVNEPIKDDFHFVMLNLSTGEYVSNFTNGDGNPAELCPNTVYEFWTDYNGPFTVQDLSWDLPSGWEMQAQYGSDNRFTTYFYVNDNVHTGLHLTVQTEECGWGNMLPGFYFLEDYSCGSYYLLISPNPSTGETTMSIESTSDEKAIDGDMEWELEIYGTNQIRKTKKIGLRGKSTKVNTSDWQEGVYPVRVIYRPKGKPEITLTGKLVVKP